MSLKSCKECGTSVSTKAVSCPKCGAVVNKQLTSADQLAYGILMIAIICGVIALVSWITGA